MMPHCSEDTAKQGTSRAAIAMLVAEGYEHEYPKKSERTG